MLADQLNQPKLVSLTTLAKLVRLVYFDDFKRVLETCDLVRLGTGSPAKYQLVHIWLVFS